MALSISATMSDISKSPAQTSLITAELKPERLNLRFGITESERDKARQSLGKTEPFAILPAILSISFTSLSKSVTESLITVESNSSSTPSRR